MQQKYLLIAGIIIIIGIIILGGYIIQNTNGKNWVEISIFGQCVEEPWGNDANIKPFFEDKGIIVYDIKVKSRGPVCEACTVCPSYDIKEILVDNINAEKVSEILESYPLSRLQNIQ